MPITREYEQLTRHGLQQQILLILDQFKIIRDAAEQKNFEDLSKVFMLEKDIKANLSQLLEKTIEIFSFAPLGKDLRRNISYIFSNKHLSDATHNAANIATYMVNIKKYKMNFKWIIELSDKLIRRLEMLVELFDSEDAEAAHKLIDRDSSVNELYRKEIKSWTKKVETIKDKITTAQKSEIAQGFILAVKNFEQAGDSIKEIAETSLFISTGKIN